MNNLITAKGEQVSNYTGQAWAGENYESRLTVKEIAGLLRGWLKEKRWTPKMGYKISVTQDGLAIRVEIKEHLQEFSVVQSEIEKFLKSYRYSDTDSMVDYFSTNFYYSVQKRWY